MAVECVHIYKYNPKRIYSNGLDLPLRSYTDSQLAITNIEGLAPVSANVNITQYAARDGGIFNSSRRQERNIVITMKLFDNPSMDAVRQKVYDACPIGEPIAIIFDWSDGSSKLIEGYVEDTPSDYFGEQEGIQVSVICPDPDFILVKKSDETNEWNAELETIQFRLPSWETIKSSDKIALNYIYQLKDDTTIYEVPSLFRLTNGTDKNQKYLFAIAFANSRSRFVATFYSNGETPKETKEINSYTNASGDDDFESGLYFFINSDSEYEEILSKPQFDYIGNVAFNVLTEAETWIENTYYASLNPVETGKWLLVTWEAEYSDESDPTIYNYPVKYGFLNASLVDNEITNNIVSIFDEQASYFTTAEKGFFNLSKVGTALAEATDFVENTFYKLVRTYSYYGSHGGFTPVLDTDDIYFFEDSFAYEYANGSFDKTIPLYGFYNTIKEYKIYGTIYVQNQFYYINDSNEEILVTSSSQPSDWNSSVNKYYKKVNTFFEITNYPGSDVDDDNVILGNRTRYDTILDYLTYKYELISNQIPFENGVYYEFLGNATTELENMYGLSSIPIYKALDNGIPDDWGTPNKYYTRTKMTASERSYELYFNDHMYSTITNRMVYEYELLDEEPSDFSENYSNYYTLDNNYSNIIAYFTPDEYTDFSKLYTLTESEPADFTENYFNYYKKTRNISDILKKVSEFEYPVLKSDSEADISCIIDINSSHILGDDKGTTTEYVYRQSGDVYYKNGYYIYNSESGQYEVVSDDNPPADFSTAPYKYFKKIPMTANFITPLTVIFWNPITKKMEYDLNQYDLFVNDFETWAKKAMSTVLKIETVSSGNEKIYREDDFITYALGTSALSGKDAYPVLKISNPNYILTKSYDINGNIDYSAVQVVGIASYIS